MVSIHTTSYVKVVVYQPLSFDDTQNIIDNLKNRKPIVVNLDSLDADLAQRVLDFIVVPSIPWMELFRRCQGVSSYWLLAMSISWGIYLMN